MREYKLVQLNKGIHFSRDKDLALSEEVLNKYISEGWTLQQIVAPCDGMGVLVAVLYKD